MAGFEMDLAFLRRVRKTSIIFGAVAAVVVSTYWGLNMGAAWAAGIAWSLVNLHFIGSVIQNVVTPEPRKPMRILAAMVIKFPILYGAGFVLLWWDKLPAAGLAAGFSWPFFVLVMKALGRVYLRMDDRPTDDSTEAKA